MPKGKYNRTHHGGGGNKGGGKGNNGGGNNGGGGKKKDAGLGALSTITATSSGKDLVKLARAMAKVEVKPQVRAYRRLVKELKGQQAADTIGLQRLGQQTQKDIAGAANAYDTGAQGATSRSAAVGGILQGQLAAQGQQAAASQQTAQTGALGGLQQNMTLQGAPGGGAAQAALGQLVAQQSARQAAETQAGQTAASAQQGAYGGLLEGMRTSGALQASTAREGVTRDIASRIAETRLQSGQDIREAAGKKADVKATKGSLMLEKLAELRAAERDYDLGRRATRTDKRGQDISAATAAAAQATTRRGQDISAATSRANSQRTAQTADENRRAANRRDRNDGGGGGGREGRQDLAHDTRAITIKTRQAVSDLGYPANSTQIHKLEKYVGASEGITDPVLVHEIVKKWLRDHQPPRGGGPDRGA